MTTNFENRLRFTESQAREALMEPTNMISHLLDNGDGTFSIMYHIVCAWCDYCEDQGDCRMRPDAPAVPAKEDPYENENLREENER